MNYSTIAKFLGDSENIRYYRQVYYCQNCGHKEEVDILKGQLKPQAITCSNCQCSTSSERARFKLWSK